MSGNERYIMAMAVKGKNQALKLDSDLYLFIFL